MMCGGAVGEMDACVRQTQEEYYYLPRLQGIPIFLLLLAPCFQRLLLSGSSRSDMRGASSGDDRATLVHGGVSPCLFSLLHGT